MGRGCIIEGGGYFNLIKDSSPVVSEMHLNPIVQSTQSYQESGSRNTFPGIPTIKESEGEGRLFEGASIFWPREGALIWGSWEGAYSKKYGILVL